MTLMLLVQLAIDGLALSGLNLDEIRQHFQHAFTGLAAAKDMTATEKLFASTLAYSTKKTSALDALRGTCDCSDNRLPDASMQDLMP